MVFTKAIFLVIFFIQKTLTATAPLLGDSISLNIIMILAKAIFIVHLSCVEEGLGDVSLP
jgi:hypothetical protein